MIGEPDSGNSDTPAVPQKLFYVHYIDYNKRLDEWVSMDRMKLDKIQPPANASGSANHQQANSTTVSVPVAAPTVAAKATTAASTKAENDNEDEEDDKESVKSASLKNDEQSGVTSSSQANKRKRKSRLVYG